jgi:hypothetical protein
VWRKRVGGGVKVVGSMKNVGIPDDTGILHTPTYSTYSSTDRLAGLT